MALDAGRRARLKAFLLDAALAAAILAISLLHYVTAPEASQFHDIYRRLYYIPIILAAFAHGTRGGVAASLLVTLLYIPHAFFAGGHGGMHHDPASGAQKALEIVLYNTVGLLTGLLVDRERAERDLHLLTAHKLAEALQEMARLEAELIRQERLLLLGQMASGLAHEIRNPLGSIKGAAEIVLSGMDPADRRREFAEILVKESARLEAFLNTFLEYAGPRPYRMDTTDLGAIASECGALLRAEAGSPAVSVSVEVEKDLPEVEADTERLRQVFQNIMQNAAQAMKDGGTLSVRVRAAGGDVKVEFADTGPGIPAESLRHVFEPFYSTKDGGTGLGLAIARRIVEDHGGRIEASNRPEGGAKIAITVPRGQ
ncbi:MAG: sensor histidine kinase [Deltaproteobacteria bacterium]|nr:sensor histidine kinase [Deltaproteobacteria bacterium]